MTEYKDFPFEEIAVAMDKIAREGQFMAFQKFTCQHCGQRLSMDVPNTLYETGTCDKCCKETNIRERGCNYLLVSDNPLMRQVLNQLKKEG